jgi:hypothetical protein
MSIDEERELLLSTGCLLELVDLMETFATKYRILTSTPGNKARRLGTRSLVRIAKRLASYPKENLRNMLERTLLVQFLPITEQEQIHDLMLEVGLPVEPLNVSSVLFRSSPLLNPDTHLERVSQVHPPVDVGQNAIVFVSRTLEGTERRYEIKRFQSPDDPDNLSLVPHMDTYLECVNTLPSFMRNEC